MIHLCGTCGHTLHAGQVRWATMVVTAERLPSHAEMPFDAAFAELSCDFTQLVADWRQAGHLSPTLEHQAQAFGLRFDALRRLVADREGA